MKKDNKQRLFEMMQKIDNSFIFKINESAILKSINDIYLRYETVDGLAYADIEKTPNGWHISMIESKKRGGGTELINKIISDAKKENVKKITLATTEFSGWGFFNKLGFKEVGNNNDPFDIPMELNIT